VFKRCACGITHTYTPARRDAQDENLLRLAPWRDRRRTKAYAFIVVIVVLVLLFLPAVRRFFTRAAGVADHIWTCEEIAALLD